MAELPALPVAEVLDRLTAAVAARGVAVLQAPPGAGKTTLVPVALAQSGAVDGKILMLEPRRVAARAAAERVAEVMGQTPGRDVGYAMRGDRKAGARIEVITDGILTRMIQSDPGLDGIGCIVFDEFHERSLQADLGLALAMEVRALRPDLALVVMSATLDAGPVAAHLGDAPVLTSAGRGFPVDVRYLDRPLGPGTLVGRGFVAAAADLIARVEGETRADPGGDILAFLPGQGEINAVAACLDVPAEVVPLHGGLPFKAQRAALRPGARRRLVLATAIAETSLTIPGVRVVVDTGRARRARLDPRSGMARLVTERVTRAEADQRTGRAGRVAPGLGFRMWTKGEEGALAPHPPAEIETADLVPLALELALWGADPADVPFLTPPAPAGIDAARRLLADLGALDPRGSLTAAGRAMGRLPIHPRLARMALEGGTRAAEMAALMEARDPLRGAPADLTLRLEALKDPDRAAAERGVSVDRNRLAEIRANAKRLRPLVGAGRPASAGALAARAYPDRIALRRPGDAPRYLLSGGSGAELDAADPLAGARLLVATDLDGDRRAAKIRQAVQVDEAELRALFPVETARSCAWSKRHRRVEARVQDRLGALVLSDRIWKDPGDAARIPALLDGVRDLGLGALNWTEAARGLVARAEWLSRRGMALPDMGEAALTQDLDTWLGPYLAGIRSFDAVRQIDLMPPLTARLGPAGEAALSHEAPGQFTAPTGTRVAIDYSGESPGIAIRLQELFGLADHPRLGPAGPPLLITLLSPAGRPVQTTADLPGFWVSSYGDVRKDMRGRYPKHPWPEDPLAASPTRRAKRKGG